MFGFCQKTKKVWKMLILVVGSLGTIPKGLKKRHEQIGNSWKNRDHPENTIAETGQNTQKNDGELKRLVVTQTPVKENLFILRLKTRED